jgi:RNA polymerase sigma factor (TIGR02999 family)
MRAMASRGAPKDGAAKSVDLPDDFTVLLRRMGSGDSRATTDLFTAVYGTLRVQARRAMRGQRRSHTLQPTALANEAFLKLVKQESAWEGRAHFLCVAAHAMRSILVDHARNKSRRKRKALGARVDIDESLAVFEDRSARIEDLVAALDRLAAHHRRASKVVEMRFFGGMKLQAVSEALGVPLRTIERDWCYARAWLHNELR